MIQYFNDTEQKENKNIYHLPFNLEKLTKLANLVNSSKDKDMPNVLDYSKIETLRKEDLERLSYLIAFNSSVNIEIQDLINKALNNLPSNIFEINTSFTNYIEPLLLVSDLYLQKIEYFLNISLKNSILYKNKSQLKIKEILSALDTYNVEMTEFIKKINLRYTPKNKHKNNKDEHTFYSKITDSYIKKIEEQISNNHAYQVFLTKKNYLIHSNLIKSYDYLKNAQSHQNEHELDNYLEEVDTAYQHLSTYAKHNLKLYLISEQEFVMNDPLLMVNEEQSSNIIKFPYLK